MCVQGRAEFLQHWLAEPTQQCGFGAVSALRADIDNDNQNLKCSLVKRHYDSLTEGGTEEGFAFKEHGIIPLFQRLDRCFACTDDGSFRCKRFVVRGEGFRRAGCLDQRLMQLHRVRRILRVSDRRPQEYHAYRSRQGCGQQKQTDTARLHSLTVSNFHARPPCRCNAKGPFCKEPATDCSTGHRPGKSSAGRRARPYPYSCRPDTSSRLKCW